MLLRRRRLTCNRLFVGLAIFILGTSACASDEGASISEGSSSSTTTTLTTITTITPTTSATGTETTSEPPVMYDVEVCMAKECIVAEDCCEDPEHPGSNCLDESTLDNWTCVSGGCVHGGCGQDEDCIIPGLKCVVVDSIRRCVTPCTSNGDCTDGTICIGEGMAVNFCLEGPMP